MIVPGRRKIKHHGIMNCPANTTTWAKRKMQKLKYTKAMCIIPRLYKKQHEQGQYPKYEFGFKGGGFYGVSFEQG